jgi:hypothetical protein
MRGIGLHGIGLGAGVRLSGGGGFAYDAIPSIAAAYGMRRLRSAYAGNLLRLRRSSDNAESDFGYLANGDLDAAAIATFVGGGSGYVTTWYDQKGSANLTQSTANAQVLYVSQAGGVDFDGSDDYFVSGITPTTDYSVLCKFSNAASNSNKYLMGTWTDSLGLWGMQPRAEFFDARGYWNGTFNLIAGVRVASGVMAIAGPTAYYNGASDGTIAGASNTGIAMIVGGLMHTATPSLFFDGNIQEIVVSASTYDAAAIAAITTIMG